MSFASFAWMRKQAMPPHQYTFPSPLKALPRSPNHNPFQFYAQILKFGLGFGRFVQSTCVWKTTTGNTTWRIGYPSQSIGFTISRDNWFWYQGIVSRFGPDVFEDAAGELTKLKQTATVKEYLEQFELLANKTQNLPESFFTSCFISGLKGEIKANVLMFRPTNTTKAIGLAKLQENSIEAIGKKTSRALKLGKI
ncbi:hypothetical protein Acr_25g0001070 [Actinidia rufa]|uniref:Retrotransposon gag domain-containing protein n=1 Tax=Actinidia rufa TaxID=165716 RepID=A0A7J0GY94_9ERIC|nr:hypothetical protein Acr_25g0001070 [Actinidia rufa]